MCTMGRRHRWSVVFIVLIGLAFCADASDRASHRALIEAARDGETARAMALIERGADVTAADDIGVTALHWASFNGNSALVERLLARGASVDARVENGTTALHQAAYSGHVEVAKRLLEAGAAINSRNERGFTPADWAAHNEHQALLDLLVARGGIVSAASMTSSHDNKQHLPATADALDASIANLTTRLGYLPSVVKRVKSDESAASIRIALDRRLKVPQQALASKTNDGATDSVAQRFVQLGSFAERARADRHRATLITKHADLLRSHPITVAMADVGRAQPFHRVRVGPLDKNTAQTLCQALKARQVSCLTVSQPP